MAEQAFAGIDVAVARNKRLPVSVCSWRAGRLEPLPLRRWNRLPPRLPGNLPILDATLRQCLAGHTVDYLRDVESHWQVGIARVGIDAPRAPKRPGSDLRACESEMDRLAIRYIQTPDEATFDRVAKDVAAYQRDPGSRKGVPHANRIWMLFGFDLFEALSQAGWSCIEVYPQATVRAIGSGERHKSCLGAVLEQLSAAAAHTGWPAPPSLPALRSVAFGSLHDCLDAYLSAWVASLPAEASEVLGTPPDEAIWRPKAL